MDWLLFIEWMGIGVPAYAIYRLINFYLCSKDSIAANKFVEVIASAVCFVLVIVSLPVFLIVGSVERLYAKRAYDRKIDELRHVQKIYLFDIKIEIMRKNNEDKPCYVVDDMIDKERREFAMVEPDGYFDYEMWRAQEFEKMGLTYYSFYIF